MAQDERRHQARKRRRVDDGVGYSVGTMESFIINRRGEEYADSNDPDFFPKAFPCLFPWGRGGPKVVEEAGVGRTGDTASEENNTDSQDHNFTLQNWARHLLRRHGMYLTSREMEPY
jgi:hypothetical protein